MIKDAVIKLTNTQTISGDSDSIELKTHGRFSKTDGRYIVEYHEPESIGFCDCVSTLEIERDKLVLSRSGSVNTCMVFERGKRHTSYYETPFGTLSIAVMPNVMTVDIDDRGGALSVNYTMDINNGEIISNGLRLEIITGPDMARKGGDMLNA